MSITLDIQKRGLSQTKGDLSALRKEGWIPAIVYGNDKNPEGLSVFAKTFLKELEVPGIRTRVYDLGDLGLALIKDMQFLPINDTPIHIDFMRLKERVIVSVPLRFMNEDKCVGLKRGGVLNVIHYNVEINVPSIAIPQELVVDLSQFEIGHSIHLSDISLPEGSSALHLQSTDTIGSIVAPSGLAEPTKES